MQVHCCFHTGRLAGPPNSYRVWSAGSLPTPATGPDSNASRARGQLKHEVHSVPNRGQGDLSGLLRNSARLRRGRVSVLDVVAQPS